MRRVFRVRLVFKNDTANEYRVEAKDDWTARKKALEIDAKSWPKNEQEAVDYCEISHICDFD